MPADFRKAAEELIRQWPTTQDAYYFSQLANGLVTLHEQLCKELVPGETATIDRGVGDLFRNYTEFEAGWTACRDEMLGRLKGGDE